MNKAINHTDIVREAIVDRQHITCQDSLHVEDTQSTAASRALAKMLHTIDISHSVFVVVVDDSLS